MLLSSIVLLASIGTVVFGQSPAAPISQGTCDALKDIAANANAQIATCTVQDGCGTMECTNPTAGSSFLTLEPCADPPFFEAQFYDLSDALVHEENLTAQHNIDFGSVVLMFTVTQIEAGITLQVNAVIGNIPVPFIAYSEIPIDTSLCDGPAAITSSSATSTPSFATSTPSSATSTPTSSSMPSESPTGSGCIEAVQLCLLMFLVLCSCWALLW